MKKLFTLLSFTVLSQIIVAQAYFDLSTGSFSQDWSNVALITTDNDWTGVPNIQGFAGADAFSTTEGTDPQTIVVPFTDLQVYANRSDPNTFTLGGVAEFDGIANPTVALQGSADADYPNIVLYMNATGRAAISLSFVARDLDGGPDNAIQPIAVQYRAGTSGNFINVPAGFIADATSGPNQATMSTPITVVLPAGANNQSQLQIRIITANAVGNDEWVGIDNIVVSSSPLSVLPITLQSFSANRNGNNNELHWQVNCLSSSVKFELQRSADAVNFQTVYTSSETKARCASPFVYSDATATLDRNYYRLRIIDVDGTSSYSKVVLISNRTNKNNPVSIRPNIVTSRANLYYISPVAEKVQWVVTDMMGRVAKNISTSVISGENKIVITTSDLSSGQYFVKGFSNSGEISIGRFVK